MKIKPHHLTRTVVSATAALVLGATSLLGQTPSGQWDFDNGNLNATVGLALSYSDGPGQATEQGTQFGTTTALGIPDINGSPAKVMGFPAATNQMGYLMNTPDDPNGAGSLVNEWTLIMDVLYPSASDQKLRPIIDTDFVGGPDFVIDATDGVGLAGGAVAGNIAPNTWYRVGLVVANTEVVVYLNGTKAGSLPGYSQDGTLALATHFSVPVFANIIGNAAPGYVNSLQLWGVALNAGQMQALGGPSATNIPTVIPPVPSFIQTRSPDVNALNVLPSPNLHVVLNQGSTTVNSSSIQLSLDGDLLPATVTATAPTFDVAYSITNLLDPGSIHTLTLSWNESVGGAKSDSWSFTVYNYQKLVLPAPFYLETFDELSEITDGPGPLPPGWTVSNLTSHQDDGFSLDDRKSQSYEDWVLVSSNRYASWGANRTRIPPIVVNGQLLSSLASGNLMWAETDQRCDGCNGQYQEMYTADIDCSGKTNVYVSWNSIYMQNQDNMNCCEYSIDQGANWLPVRYMFCTLGDGENSDIYYTNGVIDVGATFSTIDPNRNFSFFTPYASTNYGSYIKAPVSTALIPYIVGYTNDAVDNDEFPYNGMEVVLVRLPQADGQSKVRFRFLDDGTSSWYWGIDNFGLYEINLPIITTQPQSQTIDAGTPVTFSVVASSSSALTYQWRTKGKDIAGATNSSYTISSVSTNDVGQFQVVVSNSSGPVNSGLATLTVVTTPQITSPPISQVADVGTTVNLSAGARGGRPYGFFWLVNSNGVANSGSTNLTFASAQPQNSGGYQLVVTNAYGSATSSVARLTVVSGPITNSLVVHLTFDGNFNDTSGRGNNGQYAFNGTAGDTSPKFAGGQIGQSFEFTTLGDGTKMDYATLGYPDDLKLGDSAAFSVSFWVNYTNQSGDSPFISNKDWDSSGNRGWGIFPQGGGDFRENVTGINGGADKFDVHPTTILRDGKWHHIVMSYMRASGSLASYVNTYADGVLVNQKVSTTKGTIDTTDLPFTNVQGPGGTPMPSNQSTWAVNVGQDGTGVYHEGETIGGHIDDLGIWRRALSTAEAAAIYSAGQAGKDLSQAVVNTTPTPTISVGKQGNSWVITYSGTLYSSSTPNGTYAPVSGASSPYTIPTSSPAVQFYRAHNP